MGSLPGFTAEAGLPTGYRNNGRAAAAGTFETGGKIIPQLQPVTFDYCDPWQGCFRTCCTVTIEYVGPYNIPKVSKSCFSQRKPSLGCLRGGWVN